MELEFLRWLRAAASRDDLPLGLSDDAALVDFAGRERCVITVDMLTDGVDFVLAQDGPERVGRKLLAVNLSDLAAMASRPQVGVVALALPRDGALELAKRLYEGLIPLAEQFDLALAGGDTNTWDGPLVASVTLLGSVTERGPLVRSGARPGDAILVTGRLGGSRLGHQFDFAPRVAEALWLAERYELHAGIDISDGLALDLWRLCQASGCGAVVESAAIPIADDARRWAAQLGDGSTGLDHALADGEDFELILAVTPAVAEELLSGQPLACGLSCIGHFVAEPSLRNVDAAGVERPLVPRGFEH